MKESIQYDRNITRALGLSNQKLKLGAAKDPEIHIYEEPREDIEIIELLDNTPERRVLGHCTFKIYQEPVPFFYVSWVVKKNNPLSKEPEDRGKTVGDMIMEKANTFIKEKKLPGILGNVVPEGTSAHGVYERNGWVNLPVEGHWMGYNLPENMMPEQMEKIVEVIKGDDPYFQSHKS